MELKQFIEKHRKIINEELDKLLPGEKHYPKEIHSAMRYAVFSANSKRIRPILAIAVSISCGGELKNVLKEACAVELVHTYSLVHDDLPAMDNSDFRRGKPSVHKKFGEDTAILTGDALLTLAFKILANGRNYKKNCLMIEELANAAGSYGMIGGQLVDMRIKGKPTNLPTIEYVSTHKTGALIASSLRIGAIASGIGKKKLKIISQFGEYIGFAFQVIDDILDKDGITEIVGINESYDLAKGLVEKAKDKISALGKKSDILARISDYILERKK